MKNRLSIKGIVIGIIFLIFGAGVLTSSGNIVENSTIQTIGSSGYIQYLIDNATEGDTIYIPSGKYYENIVIYKSISLIGEDKNTTIINGGNRDNVVYISADWVNISGFTIENSREGHGYLMYAGIYISSNNNSITGNTIINNHYGIMLDINWYSCSNNFITNNTILNNLEDGININGDSNTIIYNTILNNLNNGIELLGYGDNTISGNIIISNNYFGIFLSAGSNNSITGNYIFKNLGGIELEGSSNNNITGNTISKSRVGISLSTIVHGPPMYYFLISEGNTIYKNNFLLNIRHARFGYISFLPISSNLWKQNYWNRPRVLPKLIFGLVSDIPPSYLIIPWFQIDWHPAKELYEI